MIVVSDTTPIIALLKADCLDLLKNMYGNVLVPKAVYRELTENPNYLGEAEIIQEISFLTLTPVENIKAVDILKNVTGLDAGESEALILYDEQKADILLMDERKGRAVAKKLNVRHIGTAGILMLAYDCGLIQKHDVKACIDTMLVSNIRLDKKICNMVMTHIGMDESY